MKLLVSSILTICMAICMAASSSGANEMWYAPQVGQAHNDFVLPQIDTRDAVTLSQYRGQKVLLIQFASW